MLQSGSIPAQRCASTVGASAEKVADVMKRPRSHRDTNEEVITLLEQCFGSIPTALLRHKLAVRRNKKYSDIIRSFVMILHFYSAKTYSFVRT